MIDQLRLWQDHILPGYALDIGVGDGEVSLWLARRGFQVEAIEPDQKRVAMLRSYLTAPIRLHAMDILAFNTPANHYALIVASAVLHFIEADQLPVLAERLIKSLLHGGMLFAAALTRDDPSAQVEGEPEGTSVKHYFNPDELRQLFQPLEVLYYEESRRISPESTLGFRSGATLVARRRSEGQEG